MKYLAISINYYMLVIKGRQSKVLVAVFILKFSTAVAKIFKFEFYLICINYFLSSLDEIWPKQNICHYYNPDTTISDLMFYQLMF